MRPLVVSARILVIALVTSSSPVAGADEASRDALSRLLGIDAHLESKLIAQLRNIPGALDSPTLKSKSAHVLQDVYVRLHNFMHDNKMLPMRTWGVGRGDGAAEFADASHPGAGDVIGRRYNLMFLRNYSRNVTAMAAPIGGNIKCLEWDKVVYINEFAACKGQKWNLKFKGGLNQVQRHGPTTILADLVTFGRSKAPARPEVSQFDLVVCMQVFEHVREPWPAAVGLLKLMKPGGLVFFSAPFNAAWHQVPRDYFRYTPDGASAVFEDAGFEVLRRHVGGSTKLTSGALQGFGTRDFPMEEYRRDNLGDASKIHLGSLFFEVGLLLRRPLIDIPRKYPTT